jgi:NADPH-dependent curcumin reductase CurA
MDDDGYEPAIPLGAVIRAGAVSEVTESRKSAVVPGDLVGKARWEDHTITDGRG